jgi:prefoldin subunit 4
MKINQFANLVAKVEDLKEDLKIRKNEMTNIDEAMEELELADDDQIQFLIGEAFICNNLEKTQELLKDTKHKKTEEIKGLESKVSEIQELMASLKKELYGKFGQKNINLENDDED